jgi:hypothetical protein
LLGAPLEIFKASVESLLIGIAGISLLELYMKALIRIKNPQLFTIKLFVGLVWITFSGVVILPVAIIPISLFKPLMSKNFACIVGLVPELSLLFYALIFKRKEMDELNRHFGPKFHQK